MVWSPLAPKYPILIICCGMDHQKSNFSLVSDALSVGGCWGQRMLLFWKLVDETQMSNPCDHAVRDIPSKLSIFLPLRAIYFRSNQYETPCMCYCFSSFDWLKDQKNFRICCFELVVGFGEQDEFIIRDPDCSNFTILLISGMGWIILGIGKRARTLRRQSRRRFASEISRY